MIRLATEEFIPVAADDWYQRRRDDAEGKFFRSVADQGPRKGIGGDTRQGIYCLTADGKLLAYRNAGQLPDVMRTTLQQALVAWKNPHAWLRVSAQAAETPPGTRSATRRRRPGTACSGARRS